MNIATEHPTIASLAIWILSLAILTVIGFGLYYLCKRDKVKDCYNEDEPWAI